MTEGLAVEPARGSSPDPLRARDEPSAVQHGAGGLIGGFRILERIEDGFEVSLFLVERVARPRGPLVAQQEARGVLALASSRRGRVDPDRFAEETRRLAGIEHPSLARPRHGGVTSDGRVWVVYDEVVGEPLDAYCEDRALSLEERVRLALEVLRALARAHAQLVLHCFLAPELLRVVEAESGPSVVVLGFGLHGLAGGRPEGTEPAREGPFSALASPEEVLGQPLSTASDVYRVGLELQRLLFGAPPEADLGGTDPESWVRAMVERGMSDPAERFAALPAEQQQRIAVARGTTPRALVERARGELGELLRSTLAEEATERPSSADALAARLEAWLDRRSAPSRGQRRRGRLLAVTGAVVLVAAGALAFEGWRRASRATASLRLDRAVDRALVESLGTPSWPEGLEAGALPAALERRLDSADPGFVVELLGRSAELAAAGGDAGRADALHGRALERVLDDLGEGSPEAAAAALRRARTAASLGSADAAERASEALAAARLAHPARALTVLEGRLLVAEAAATQAPVEALDLADRLIADLATPSPWWRPSLLSSHADDGGRQRLLLRARLLRGRALLASGQPERVRVELAALADDSTVAAEPILAAAARRLVALAADREEVAPAERVAALEGALAAWIEAAGEPDRAAIDLAERLALALAAEGRLEGAIARAARTAELADDLDARVRAWEQVGRWQLAAGRPNEAAGSFAAALELLDPASADRHRVALHRVDAWLRAGDPRAAEVALEELPAGADREAAAGVRAARARVLAALGRAEGAVALREALDSLQGAGSEDTLVAVPTLLALGELLLAEGDAIVAEAYLRRGLSVLEAATAPGFRIAEARSALGEALLAQGRVDEARALLQGAAGELAGRDDHPAREARRRLGLLESP